MKKGFNLKNIFTFTKSEKNGALVLLAIVILLIIFPYIYDLFSVKKEYDYNAFKKEVAEFEASLKSAENKKGSNRLDNAIMARYDSLKLFTFNPNSTTVEQWKRLGLTDKQIKTIEKYKTKGGKFFEKDDFKRMYGIRETQYEILKPFINLPDKHERSIASANQIPQEESDNESETEIALFNFDPNQTTAEQWKSLGLSDKQISTIEKYTSKGGKFFKKEDFKKIYGISEELYAKLEPFIQIADNKKIITASEEVKAININSLSQEELEENKAFKRYAKSIVKYRELLGGYYKKEQLLEVYGMTQEAYDKISPGIIISASEIKKKRINFVNVEELKHPYISYQEAKEIIKFRSRKGPFTNLNQLVTNKLLSEETFDKVKVYLTVE